MYGDLYTPDRASQERMLHKASHDTRRGFDMQSNSEKAYKAKAYQGTDIATWLGKFVKAFPHLRGSVLRAKLQHTWNYYGQFGEYKQYFERDYYEYTEVQYATGNKPLCYKLQACIELVNKTHIEFGIKEPCIPTPITQAFETLHKMGLKAELPTYIA